MDGGAQSPALPPRGARPFPGSRAPAAAGDVASSVTSQRGRGHAHIWSAGSGGAPARPRPPPPPATAAAAAVTATATATRPGLGPRGVAAPRGADPRGGVAAGLGPDKAGDAGCAPARPCAINEERTRPGIPVPDTAEPAPAAGPPWPPVVVYLHRNIYFHLWLYIYIHFYMYIYIYVLIYIDFFIY